MFYVCEDCRKSVNNNNTLKHYIAQCSVHVYNWLQRISQCKLLSVSLAMHKQNDTEWETIETIYEKTNNISEKHDNEYMNFKINNNVNVNDSLLNISDN